MNNLVTWDIELDHPNLFVTFEASEDASDDELLELAIKELTRKTEIYSKKIIKRRK